MRLIEIWVRDDLLSFVPCVECVPVPNCEHIFSFRVDESYSGRCSSDTGSGDKARIDVWLEEAELGRWNTAPDEVHVRKLAPLTTTSDLVSS